MATYHLDIRGTGTGPAFLFVHGLASDRRCWQPLVALAPADARLLLLDLPDSGAALDVRSTDLKLLEDAVVACAGHAGDGELTVVGNCFGAHLLARLLARLTHRVTRAVLIGGYASLPDETLDELLDTLGGLQCGRLTLEDLGDYIAASLGEEADEEHERLAHQLLDTVTADRAVRAFSRIAASAAGPVPRWETPTVVVHARHDAVIPVRCAEALSEHGRRCELVTLDSDSHLPQLTHAEELAPIVFG